MLDLFRYSFHFASVAIKDLKLFFFVNDLEALLFSDQPILIQLDVAVVLHVVIGDVRLVAAKVDCDTINKN